MAPPCKCDKDILGNVEMASSVSPQHSLDVGSSFVSINSTRLCWPDFQPCEDVTTMWNDILGKTARAKLLSIHF